MEDDNKMEVRGMTGLEHSKTRYSLKLTYASYGESVIVLCLITIREFL